MSVLNISENDRAVLNSIFNPLTPIGEAVYDEDLTDILPDEEDRSEEVKRAKMMELQGIGEAESGNTDGAIKLFTEALSIAKTASGYNNRAQAYRLQGKEKEALKDLNSSLELSKGQRRSGCQALCQRGLLYRKSGKETEAKQDFTKAVQIGSKFAKQQLIEMNPYAAMCNQMLNVMMSTLKCPPQSTGNK